MDLNPSVPDQEVDGRQEQESPFDASARTYDAEFTEASIGRWQRRVVWDGLEESLLGSERVLEVGCGTGEDALFMARLGCSVIATDGSERMVEVAREKVAKAGMQRLVIVCSSRLPHLSPLLGLGGRDEFDAAVGARGEKGEAAERGEDVRRSENGDSIERARVDRVFSDFGALNCLSPGEMRRFFRESRQRLQPGGRLLLVLMPESCWWESLYFLLRGHWRKASRRKHSPQRATLESRGAREKDQDQAFEVWYYSPSALAELATGFTVRELGPVGFLVPPSLMQRWFHGAPGVWLGSLLAWGDRKISRAARRARGAVGKRLAGWLARHSDHYWVEFDLCGPEEEAGASGSGTAGSSSSSR